MSSSPLARDSAPTTTSASTSSAPAPLVAPSITVEPNNSSCRFSSLPSALVVFVICNLVKNIQLMLIGKIQNKIYKIRDNTY